MIDWARRRLTAVQDGTAYRLAPARACSAWTPPRHPPPSPPASARRRAGRAIRPSRGDDADWRTAACSASSARSSDPDLERLHRPGPGVPARELPQPVQVRACWPGAARSWGWRRPVGAGAPAGKADHRPAPRASSSRAGRPRPRRAARVDGAGCWYRHGPPRVREGRTTSTWPSRVPVGSDSAWPPSPPRLARRARQTHRALAWRSCYPYGVVDPIPGWPPWPTAGALFHVDACLDGWPLPFLEALGGRAPVGPVVPAHFAVGRSTSTAGRSRGCPCSAPHQLLAPVLPVLRLPGGLYGSATTGGHPAAPRSQRLSDDPPQQEGYLRLAGGVAPPAWVPRRHRGHPGLASPATRSWGS